jgi:hypothetical protein
VQNVNSQKAQNAATKSAAIEGRNAKSQAQAPVQAQANGTDSSVAHQQGQEQNTGDDTNETGERVRVVERLPTSNS